MASSLSMRSSPVVKMMGRPAREGSKTTSSPREETTMASRREPGPLSLVLVTVRVAACIPGARDEALARSVTDTPHSKYLFMKVLETGAGGIISQCLEEQEGLGSVSVLGGLSLAPGNLVGIDPSQNLVRLAAPPPIQPFQSSSSLFIDYPDDSWQYTFSVPAGKLLTIEYVSGSFPKKMGGSVDPSQP